jgi:esterase
MSFLNNFHYQLSGNPQGHKLVFLHGLMGSSSNWLRVAPAFQQDFHILTFDQRGHGRSFHPASGYLPKDYADDLKHILDELGWNSSALVGHSMGARNALAFAGLFSQRVKVLVLEDVGPDSSFPAVERISRLLNLVPTPFPTRERAKAFFGTEYPRLIADFYPQPETLGRFFLANLQALPDGTQDWRFSKDAILESLRLGRREDHWDTFANLKMPVLVVRGANSLDLAPALFERMMRTLAGVRGIEIAGAGHWVHFDQPEAFIKALKDFFHDTLGTNL